MSLSFRWLGAGTGAVALAALGAWVATPSRDVARETARAMHARALERFANLDWAEMARLLLEAHAADPLYVPAVLDLQFTLSKDIPAPPLREAAERIADEPNDPLALCAQTVRATFAAEKAPPLSATLSVAECQMASQLTTAASNNSTADLIYRLWRKYPESAVLTWQARSELMFAEKFDELEAMIGYGSGHTTLVQQLHTALAVAWLNHHRKRHQEAILAEEGSATIARLQPGLQALLELQHPHGQLDDPSLVGHEHALASRRARESWRRRFWQVGERWTRLIVHAIEARYFLDTGNLAESISYSDRVVALADSTADALAMAEAYLIRGRAMAKAGRTTEAEQSLLQSRHHAKSSGSLRSQYEAEHNLLHVFESQRRDAEARQAGRSFIELTQRAPLRPVRLMSYRDLGLYLRGRGDWESARPLLDSMVAITNALADSTSENYYFAGEYFESVGQLDSAAAYYRRDRRTGPRALEALSRLSEWRGDSSAAEQYALMSDSLRAKFYPEARPLWPGLLSRQGRYEEALPALESARREALQRGQAVGWARLTLDLATAELRRGRMDRAAALGDSAASGADRVSDVETTLRANGVAASARVHTDARATELAKLRTLRAEALTRRNPSLEMDLALLHADALAKSERLDEALAALARADVLVDAIAGGLGADVARAQYRTTQLAPSNRAFTLMLGNEGRSGAAATWAEWSRRRKSRGILSAGVARHLRAEPAVAVLDYIVTDSLVGVLVVSERGAVIQRLPTTPASITDAVSRIYSALAPRLGSYVDLHRARFDTDAAAELFHALLAPVLAQIDDVKQLVIVPDGMLQLVPFDALVTSEGVTPRYVLERWTVDVALTLSSALQAPGRVAPGDVVILASAQSESQQRAFEREADIVGRAFPERRVNQLRGAGATESALRNNGGRVGVLHIAAHARPNLINPDLAEIQIAADSAHDGSLLASEVRQLQLDGALVVLSACETAIGPVAATEGPLSLGRAFFLAGASRVIATLTPVGDHASRLMRGFYTALSSGETPAEALRLAKLAELRAGTSARIWVPFVGVFRSGTN